MIIVLKAGATGQEVDLVEEKIRSYGLAAHTSRGVERTIIGAIGDERKMQPEAFEGMECVEKVLRILKPFKIGISRRRTPSSRCGGRRSGAARSRSSRGRAQSRGER